MEEAAKFYLRYGRTWPITSVIEITIDMPEDEELPRVESTSQSENRMLKTCNDFGTISSEIKMF
jgi:hypothetical protein